MASGEPVSVQESEAMTTRSLSLTTVANTSGATVIGLPGTLNASSGTRISNSSARAVRTSDACMGSGMAQYCSTGSCM